MPTPLIESQLHKGNLLLVQTAGAFGTVYAAISQPPPSENIQGPRRSAVHDAIDALELTLANGTQAPSAEPPPATPPETPTAAS